jgi:predicted alpha/beta-fold hydrolase
MYILADFEKEQNVKVKSYQRLRNGKLQNVRSFDSTRRKGDEDKPNNTGRNLLISTGVVTGVIAAAAIAIATIKPVVMKQAAQNINTTYDANLKKSLQKKYNPIVKPLEYKDDDIMFVVNGLNGVPNEADQYNDIAKIMQDLNKSNKKINVIPFTIKHETGGSINPINMMGNLYAGEKATDKVVELSETVKAYQKQYPNKKITMLGFSMGGSTVTNTADLLKDNKVQTIAFAAPNIRKVQPPNYTAIRVKSDGILPDDVFTGKETVVDDIRGHNNIFASKKGFDILYSKIFNK